MYLRIYCWKLDKEIREDYHHVKSIDIDNMSVSIQDKDGVVTYKRNDVISIRVEED